MKRYNPPSPNQEETDLFHRRAALIRQFQSELAQCESASYSRVQKYIQDIEFMRKQCRLYNQKFRVKNVIP